MSLHRNGLGNGLDNDSGQAFLEYILLLVIVVGAFLAIMDGFGKADIGSKIVKYMEGDFSRAYRYGHPKALGFDDGGPQNYPKAAPGTNNGRLFFANGK